MKPENKKKTLSYNEEQKHNLKKSIRPSREKETETSITSYI